MKDINEFIDAGNVKFRSAFRESMYFVIRDKDESGLFKSISHLFYVAFAIGYHFDKQSDIKKNAINHVNLVSFDRDIKELMARLILKKDSTITDSKKLWKEVEKYAEYGIEVLFESWKKKGYLEIPEIVGD